MLVFDEPHDSELSVRIVRRLAPVSGIELLRVFGHSCEPTFVVVLKAEITSNRQNLEAPTNCGGAQSIRRTRCGNGIVGVTFSVEATRWKNQLTARTRSEFACLYREQTDSPIRSDAGKQASVVNE